MGRVDGEKIEGKGDKEKENAEGSKGVSCASAQLSSSTEGEGGSNSLSS